MRKSGMCARVCAFIHFLHQYIYFVDLTIRTEWNWMVHRVWSSLGYQPPNGTWRSPRISAHSKTTEISSPWDNGCYVEWTLQHCIPLSFLSSPGYITKSPGFSNLDVTTLSPSHYGQGWSGNSRSLQTLPDFMQETQLLAWKSENYFTNYPLLEHCVLINIQANKARQRFWSLTSKVFTGSRAGSQLWTGVLFCWNPQNDSLLSPLHYILSIGTSGT